MIDCQATADGVRISVRAKPAARRNKIEGEHAGSLKVSVTAPPEDGKANDAIVRLLAESLGLHRSQVSILQGPRSPNKVVLFQGIGASELAERIARLIGSDSPSQGDRR